MIFFLIARVARYRPVNYSHRYGMRKASTNNIHHRSKTKDLRPGALILFWDLRCTCIIVESEHDVCISDGNHAVAAVAAATLETAAKAGI